ncbi:hypothetical protein [Glycomyces tenuis]|uniref:hypothetical protein n=1 Tax=Glycomyces tenuis TaxID=58116 RepID=UPI0004139C96|nr:hypothetical protein [Glycomyces tenuis]
MGTELDPEALEEYRTVIRGQLDHLEAIIPVLSNGEPLGRMPAFGQMDGSNTARENYTAFHETTWNNLQDLREAMYGMIKTLNETADLAEESDQAAATDMQANYDDLLGDASTQPDSDAV